MADARVETVLSPPWSTDDITEEGRRKLEGVRHRPAGARRRVRARCSPTRPSPARNAARPHTAKISEFGSTACKALWRCEACAEPFDYFKCL